MLKGVSQIQASHLWLDCWMKVASKTSVSLPGLCQCCHREGNFLFCRALCQILLGLVEARSTENPWKPQSAWHTLLDILVGARVDRYYKEIHGNQGWWYCRPLSPACWRKGAGLWSWKEMLKPQHSSKTPSANNPDCKLSQTPHCSCSSLFSLDQTNLWRNAALSAVLGDAKSWAPLLRIILLVRMWGWMFPDMILCTPENLMPGTDGMWRSGWAVGLYKECSSRNQSCIRGLCTL